MPRALEQVAAGETVQVASSARAPLYAAGGEQAVASDFPASMPVLRDEVAILRAYLGREIDTILFGEE